LLGGRTLRTSNRLCRPSFPTIRYTWFSTVCGWKIKPQRDLFVAYPSSEQQKNLLLAFGQDREARATI